MTRLRSFGALVVPCVLLAVAACGSDDSTSDPATSDTSGPGTADVTEPTGEEPAPDSTAAPTGDEPQALRSDAERLRPAADAPVDDIVMGSNDAGFALHQQLGVGDENVVVSPASLSIAFAMALAGADDPTAAQLADVFGFPPGQATHEAMNALLRDLEPDNANDPDKGAATVMSVANSGWAQDGAEIGGEFLDTLAAQYGSGLFTTDFAGDPEGSRKAINAWVDDRTRGLIPELIARGQLDPSTIYTLVNALYFKAAWTNTFDEASTKPVPFTKPDGSRVDVPMMSDDHRSASYLLRDDLTAVTLPYGDGEFHMKVVMPRQLGTFLGTLNAQRWSQLDSALEEGDVNLTLPKWETEAKLDLADPLTAMGLPIPGGHYPGVAPGTEVGAVKQGAKVMVDETGTEAAAATAVAMRTSGPIGGPVDITIDRPFFYTIEHVPSGLVLFAGQVVSPG